MDAKPDDQAEEFYDPVTILKCQAKTVPMTILELGYLCTVRNALTIHQTCIVGLGILENDGSGWVGGHIGRDFFQASDDFKRWTLHIRDNYTWILKVAGIYDAVSAFQDRLTLDNREVVRAILERYWVATNTFVMPNNELGFSMRGMKEITDLPILAELYEKYVPLDG